MACNPLTAGYRLGSVCKSQSGIKAAYLGNFQTGLIKTYDTDGAITAITATSPATIPDFYKIELKSETGSFTTTDESSNGMIKYTDTLVISIQALSPKILKLVKGINIGYFIVIVEMVDGQFMICGHDDFAADTVSNEISSGTAMTDIHGSTMTISCVSPKGAEFLTADAFADLTII